MMKDELPGPFKKNIMRIFLSFIITAFVVPFITYDTGVRCITSPCPEAATRGGLVEFFAKAHNLNAYIIDYYLFIVVFVAIFLMMFFIDKWSEK